LKNTGEFDPMPVTVLVPTPLQKLTNGNAEVSADGANIADVVASLETQFPGIKERLCDDSGRLRRFVNVYLNNEDIRFAQNEETPVKDGDELSIIPAIAGG
jgi:molybdopterin synthase sulfur carrier subunit